MTKNKESTRYYSELQEKRVAENLNGSVCPNSGAGKFSKSDVQVKDASLSIECKTCMTDKDSFSIKKSWFEKQKEEAFSNRLDNSVIAFNFGPSDKNDKFIIDYKLMRFLVEKLTEENTTLY